MIINVLKEKIAGKRNWILKDTLFFNKEFSGSSSD
jgi:hypothetical protein